MTCSHCGQLQLLDLGPRDYPDVAGNVVVEQVAVCEVCGHESVLSPIGDSITPEWVRRRLAAVRGPKRVRVIGDLFHGRVPDGAVYVGRAAPGLLRSPFHNPYRVQDHGPDGALRLYRGRLRDRPDLVAQARVNLAGRDLACWCRLDRLCHADILLAVVAGEAP